MYRLSASSERNPGHAGTRPNGFSGTTFRILARTARGFASVSGGAHARATARWTRTCGAAVCCIS